MKTFVTAAVMLSVIVGFVVWNAADLQKTFDEMIALTEALPLDTEDFKQNTETRALVDKLYALWDKKFARIAFTCGYENCNRADEAINALFIHYQTGSAADFAYTRLLLWDSLRRLRMLEGFHFDSIL